MGSKQVRAPIWFIAHGGPPTIFDVKHPAHQHWLKVSNDIKAADPKGIIFISAHWQAENSDFDDASARNSDKSILMNINSSNPMIYDFYGFPRNHYEIQIESRNPPELQEAVSKHLKGEGYYVEETDRGIDHGVWVPLRAAGEKLATPLIQISLPISGSPYEDGIAALRLGKALRGLREEGYAIIGGGQPVHNLRDFRMGRSGISPPSLDYGKNFSDALTNALKTTRNEEIVEQGEDPARCSEAKSLYKRSDIQAHPTSEHLLPAFVALGAAEDFEAGDEEFKMNEGPLAWNMYRFG